MTKSFSTPAYDERRLRELINVHCEESMSSDQLQELELLLEESDAARSLYIQLTCIHIGLSEEINIREQLAEVAIGEPNEGSGQQQDAADGNLLSRSLLSLVKSRLIAAAIVLLLIPLTILSALFSTQDAPVLMPGTSGEVADAAKVVAEIQAQSNDSQWYFDGSTSMGPQNAIAGDMLRVTQGVVEVEFVSGVIASINSPAVLEIGSPMKARVLRGRLTVEVPEGAEGFAVETPRTSVVDLGTVFGVEVDDLGLTDVVVFKGKVDLEKTVAEQDSNLERRDRQRLNMGDAVRVDHGGAIQRLVSIQHGHYSLSTDSADSLSLNRSPVITSVSDNLSGTGSLRFFEVVPGGMNEDALAFVDRESHQWNGVDASGMPKYLIGGDYLKTFNDDKFASNLEIRVELAGPAYIYVLFDNRLPVPDWLRERFEDTGDDIGIDEGPHVFPSGIRHNRQSGNGAGASIDRTHSVWKQVVHQQGQVRLGATEANKLELNEPELAGTNMYGIVVVPMLTQETAHSRMQTIGSPRFTQSPDESTAHRALAFVDES